MIMSPFILNHSNLVHYIHTGRCCYNNHLPTVLDEHNQTGAKQMRTLIVRVSLVRMLARVGSLGTLQGLEAMGMVVSMSAFATGAAACCS